jgi:hypothetical protein
MNWTWSPFLDFLRMRGEPHGLERVKKIQAYMRKLAAFDPHMEHLGYPKSRRAKPAPDAVDLAPDAILTHLAKTDWDGHTEFDNHYRNNIFVELVTIPSREQLEVDYSTFEKNRLTVSQTHLLWQQPDQLRELLKMGIEHWECDEAAITPPQGVNGDNAWVFWLRWKKDGTKWTWEREVMGEPASAEPWLGGTLYIWPENAPWLPTTNR